MSYINKKTNPLKWSSVEVSEFFFMILIVTAIVFLVFYWVNPILKSVPKQLHTSVYEEPAISYAGYITTSKPSKILFIFGLSLILVYLYGLIIEGKLNPFKWTNIGKLASIIMLPFLVLLLLLINLITT